ncbi:GGDEF domain-containing protein [Sphingomonas soli]|uniref:GGDEF domain-containing protein n=1 Tax=Sphingomonas soli TaxID=266127 RepID=UPI001C3F19E0|nr:GGDEF domain-containing protein [Sphingomonas soli]
MLQAIVSEHGEAMVAKFYETLMRDADAAQFLSNDAVHGRLSTSLLDWLRSLLDVEAIQDSPALQEKQRVVGQVHARIKIPIHVVMEGAIILKKQIFEHLRARDDEGALEVAQLADERIDRAIMLMSQAYVKDTTDGARLDEAYRLFSLDQDLTSEKEAQRASLLAWSQKSLFALLRGEALEKVSESEFGFWIRHRAEFMFQNSAQLRDLLAEIETIDTTLLPQLAATPARNTDLLASLQVAIDRVGFLVSELFQTLSAMEVGRDPLTRALNRRFLPAILGREVTYANSHQTPLSIMLIDVDRFKAINDTLGHQTGDVVLRQVAQVIMDNVRPSDFVFRYGGEEFLIVSAETPLEEAHGIAERIRESVAAQPYDVAQGTPLRVTASIGLAAHSGHPDQSYFIKAADDALYRAKANGRNRIEIAG